LFDTFSSLYPVATMVDVDPRREKLHCAIEVGDDVTLLSIVRGSIDVNGVYEGWTHLFCAASYNLDAVVSCHLELGADADKTAPGGRTPLAIAAAYGHQQVVEL
jgi:ankyrin repeat protein